ncbi:hypothetical protein D3C75_886580 [compost metagenome]
MHGSAMGVAEPLAVPLHVQRQVHTTVAPGVAEFVGGNRHRSKAAGGLGLDKTEAGLHFPGRQCTQADVVELQHQTHMLQGPVRRAAHGHVVHQHHKLALEIDAVGLAGQGNVGPRPKKVVAGPLIDQRYVLDAIDGVQVEGLLHQLAVAEEG